MNLLKSFFISVALDYHIFISSSTFFAKFYGILLIFYIKTGNLFIFVLFYYIFYEINYTYFSA